MNLVSLTCAQRGAIGWVEAKNREEKSILIYVTKTSTLYYGGRWKRDMKRNRDINLGAQRANVLYSPGVDFSP